MSEDLNWQSLVFGSYSHAEVKLAVSDVHWQMLRSSLRDASLHEKYTSLHRFIAAPTGPPIELRRIAVTNYIHALARAGLIPDTVERMVL